jgi:hypothetical protein
VAELQQRLAAEIEARTRDAAAAAELRGQLGALSQQLARSIQERDAAVGAGWEQERAELVKRLQDKDATLSSLTSAFQRMVKGPK